MIAPESTKRFWARVDKTGGCWLWKGSVSVDGYGSISVDGRLYKAHRVGWELAFGPIPPGLLVCHRCDTPPCVNPAHLFLGTNADNQRDSSAKGRHSLAASRAAAVLRKGRTHCAQGHEFSSENTGFGKARNRKPQRICRACKRARTAAWKVKAVEDSKPLNGLLRAAAEKAAS